MRKLLNTLYITSTDLNLRKEGSNIVIEKNDEILHKSPAQLYESIICFNYTGMSPALIGLCMEKNIGVSFMSPSGRLKGRVIGPTNGNVLLRREQYRIADDTERSVAFAKNFIFSKIFNAVQVLRRSINSISNEDKEKVNDIISLLRKKKDAIYDIETLESLLGVEGDAAKLYFSVLNLLISNEDNGFQFSERNRRPPKDPVNAMLSFSYALIRIMIENALETVGLDPYVGFYHQDRPGRTGLALDMMEELRAYMGDRFVLSLINRKQITLSDFYTKENSAVLFTEGGMKKFLSLWQSRNHEILTHPFLEEKLEIGLIPYAQALLMARTIRGDLEMYPPFFMN